MKKSINLIKLNVVIHHIAIVAGTKLVNYKKSDMDAEPSTSNKKNEKYNVNNQRLIAESGGRCMSTQAMQSLYDFRQNNLLCDAILRLEDGGVFPIHRAILSACSTYFRFNFNRRIRYRLHIKLFHKFIEYKMIN